MIFLVFCATVQVQGRALYVDGKPFFIKGVCYQPVPVGGDYTYPWWEYPEIYEKDFDMMQQMGVNTIRMWRYLPNTVDAKAFMDSAYNHGIYVIMNFYPPDSGYSDPTFRETLKNEFINNMVSVWKDHPAILFWAIGNEHNYRVPPAELGYWYQFVNECAQAAHSVDPNHPVAIVNGEIGNIGVYDAYIPYVDIWGANVYRGESFGDLFSVYASVSDKPFWLSEYGCDAVDGTTVDEYGQASVVASQWGEIDLNSFLNEGVCIGGTLMEWSDEWWKAGDAWSHDFGGFSGADPRDGFMNEEWWGVVDVNRNPRVVYNTLKNLWAQTGIASTNPKTYSDNNPDTLFTYNLFPNPFSDELNILILPDSTQRVTVQIMDLWGRPIKKIFNGYISSETIFNWDAKNELGEPVSQGIYFVVLQTSSGKTAVERVVYGF